MAHPRSLLVFASLPLLCAGERAILQNEGMLESAGELLWQSFQPVPSNSTRPIDFTIESTWQERSRRWHVAQGWAQDWILTCWRGLSALILLKAACMLSNMVFQISPVPLIQSIVKKQDTGDVDAAPLICIAFGCCQWTFYGTFAWWTTNKGGFLVLVYANVMGALLGTVYVMLYHFHCKSEEWWRTLKIYYRIAVTIVLFQLLILFFCPRQQALILVGAIASSCSLMTAISPLFGLPRVVQLKCSKSIPLPLVLASAVSAILWAACGIQLNDPMISGPNMIAIAANTVLLGFASYYPQEETLPFEEATCEKEKLYMKHQKEGYEATLKSLDTSKDSAANLSLDEWQDCEEHGSVPEISGGSGGTF